ncbi:hypothetical protein CS022_06870 [Veronia nyctiphanis]|uniref:Rieske domain-containing protein n=1 Tax=Veronia nyctiphanis TaxID=1278244 RepID=A0A4V1LT52_9GAMM|nr:Rieske (2Fe-2S) protein [Veronia nyctiphanis]RXJ73988.1 hypothetical protein CS022_06870 [Veronia nyctiphanis]
MSQSSVLNHSPNLYQLLGNFLVDKYRRYRLSSANTSPLICSLVQHLPIRIERMFENAIDGEHLPFLHSSTFAEINILESGRWGWEAELYMRPKSFMTKMRIRLELDRERNCWVTKTLSGLGKGTEIRTHAIPKGENQIKVVIDFYVPKLPGFLHKKYSEYYLSTYQRLYEEDFSMMSERQLALDFNKQGARRPRTEYTEGINLGLASVLQSEKSTMFVFDGKKYCLRFYQDKWIAYSATCPHMLGPLNESEIADGHIVCPWHNYRFDINTGQCSSNANYCLTTPPDIYHDPATDELWTTGRV